MPRHIYEPDNPERPPEWRWLRAAEAVAGTLPVSRHRDDAATRRVCAFRRRYEEVTAGSLTEDELCAADRALFRAQKLWQNRGGRALTALKLECRCLAREPVESIALRLGLAVETVRVYEQAFFDVRSQLDCEDWVLNVVLGRDSLNVSERNTELLWKFWAYRGGAHILDDLSQQAAGIPQPKTAAGITGFWKDGTRQASARKAFFSVLQVPTNNVLAQASIITAHQKFCELEKSTSTGSAGSSGLPSSTVDGLAASLGCLPFSVDGRTPEEVAGRKLDSTVARAAATGADGVERRGDELLALALGRPGEPPDLSEVPWPAPSRRGGPGELAAEPEAKE